MCPPLGTVGLRCAAGEHPAASGWLLVVDQEFAGTIRILDPVVAGGACV